MVAQLFKSTAEALFKSTAEALCKTTAEALAIIEDPLQQSWPAFCCHSLFATPVFATP